MTEHDDEDVPPLEPPSRERVYRRALVLAALVCRADRENDPDGESFRAEVVEWLEDTDVGLELELRERETLSAPIGALDERTRIDCSWRSEGMAVLAWALNAFELPPYDEQVLGASDIAELLGFMSNQARNVPDALALRPHTDIERFGEVMFSLHWRLRQFSLDQKPMDFVQFAEDAWFRPLRTDGLRFLERDLAIGDKPLAHAAEWRDVLSITMERHQAVNWLLGHEPEYSQVTTDT